MQNTLSEADIDRIKKARQQTQIAAAQGFSIEESPTVPTQAYETYIPIDGLPSTGLFYTGTLRGQPLKVEDMLLIQTINGDNNFKVFGEIFARRFNGVNTNDILSCDELYLALWLRANSYPGYNFPHDGFECRHCETSVPSGLVDFNFLDMDFKQANFAEVAGKFAGSDSTVLTLKSGKEVGLVMRRRKHNLKVMNLLHRDFYAYGTTPPDKLVQLLYLGVVLDFGTSDLMETTEHIQALSVMDYNSLLNQVKKYTLTGDPTIMMKCPACQEVTRFNGYTFQPDIYFPSDE